MVLKHGLYVEEVPSDISVLNKDIETELHKAFSKFCIAKEVDLSWISYNGITSTAYSDGSILLEGDFSVKLNHKVGLPYETN